MKHNHKIRITFFVASLVILFTFIYNFTVAMNTERNITVESITPIIQLIEKQRLNKPLEEITVEDILENENVSDELKNRLNILLSKVQYEIDEYRTIIENYHKDTDKKLLDLKKEINALYTMRDKISMDAGIYKWMVISLCVGVGCLTCMLILMWKSVMNVNRNEVEVLYAIDNLKKDIKKFEQILESDKNNEKL